MQPHLPKRPAFRFAVLAAAAAVLSLSALARTQLAARGGGDEEARKQEEEVKRLQQQMIEQQKAMKGKTTAKGKVQAAPVVFQSIPTDPEGITFGQKSSSLEERVG